MLVDVVLCKAAVQAAEMVAIGPHMGVAYVGRSLRHRSSTFRGKHAIQLRGGPTTPTASACYFHFIKGRWTLPVGAILLAIRFESRTTDLNRAN
jgi:hypothetical protein